jgi:hypothetical protein
MTISRAQMGSQLKGNKMAKREGARKGKQFVAQPKKIAKKTAKYRK